MLYDRDSDDSSSEGGFSDHHVAMGIANDKCGDDDRYSLDSDLFTDASNDEMDGTGLDGNFNPAGLRITAGARVGIDTDDESDDDGEHGLYHQDKDIAYRGMGDRSMLRGGGASISSGSFSSGNSSDDDIDWNMRGNGKNQTWIKDDAQLDDGMPIGTARAGRVVDAGNSSKMDAEELQHARGEAEKGEQAKESRVKESIAKNKSRALVQEALAKARASKNPTAKAFLERRADILARGTDTGKKVVVGGVLQSKRSGQVLAPSVRAKGVSALQVLAKPSPAKGRLVDEVTLQRADATARKEGEQEAKADKLFLSKSFAKLREATRLRKIKKLAEETTKAEGKRILLRAVLRKWISVTEKNTLSRQLDARDRALLGTLQKGSLSDDEADAEERTVAGGGSVVSKATGEPSAPSVVSTRIREIESKAGGGAPPPAVAKGETYVPIKAEEVASIVAEGGYVYNKVNIIRLSGKSVMTINGTKLTSNEVNRGIVTELIAHYDAQPKSAEVKKLLNALNLKKTMMDAGRGGGAVQTIVNLRRPTPSRKLRKGGGGAE